MEDWHPTNALTSVEHIECDQCGIILSVDIKKLATHSPDELVPLHLLLLLFDESRSSEQVHIMKHVTLAHLAETINTTLRYLAAKRESHH